MGPSSRYYVEYTTKTVIEGGYVLTVQDLDSTIIVKDRDYVATSQSKSDETVKESDYVVTVQGVDSTKIVRGGDYVATTQGADRVFKSPWFVQVTGEYELSMCVQGYSVSLVFRAST